MLSSRSRSYDEYHVCYFIEQEKEAEEEGPRAEAEEEGRRAEAKEDGRPAEVEEDSRRPEMEEDGRRAVIEEEGCGHEEPEDAYAGQSRDMVRDEYRTRGLPQSIPKKKADIVAALQKDDLRRLE